MGELSKKEKEVLNFLLEYIDFQIFCIEQQERDLGRLDYSLCSDDNEKQTVTTKKVQKFKKKISKCNPIIAGYLNALTTPDPLNTGFEELRQIISKNFILTEYYELFEELTNSDLKDLERYKFESVIESLGYDNKPLNDFIQGVCDVNSFFTYKSFLDIPKDTDLTYDKVVKKLNDAFFKLEAFMNGTINSYKYFDFNTAFTELFYFTRKAENYTYENCKLIGEYWQLAEQIRRDYDQSDFKNLKANQNKDFCKNCDVITSIAWDRVEEFTSFATSDEINFETRKKSISDIINNKQGVITINKLIDTKEDVDIKNIDNHQKSKAINLFTEKLCDVSILDETPFSELYPWYFIEFTTNLKDEVINNLTFLTDAKFDLYLNWLSDKIENSYVYDPEACIIERWIKEFNLIEAEFPFDFNQDVSKLISSFDDTTLKPDEARKVRMIQLEFHWYAVYLEYKKIMTFISELKTNKSSGIIIPDETKPTNPYPRIFKDYYSFSVFQKLHNEFANTKENLSNYSYVFYKMTYEGLIHFDLLQKTYIEMLSDFDIAIDRIKPKGEIGKIALRDSIYAKAK
jgi:hypothetical protein